MPGKIAALAAMLLLVTALAACEKPKSDNILIVMKNQTGRHMTNFVLDHNTGKVKYEIFSRDYTFSADARPPSKPVPITVEYYDEAGKKVAFELERPLSPDMNGGVLRIYFKGGEEHEMSVDWP